MTTDEIIYTVGRLNGEEPIHYSQSKETSTR